MSTDESEPGHEQVRIEWEGTSADVDAGIANLILACWRHGLRTLSSCQEIGPNYAYVTFSNARKRRGSRPFRRPPHRSRGDSSRVMDLLRVTYGEVAEGHASEGNAKTMWSARFQSDPLSDLAEPA